MNGEQIKNTAQNILDDVIEVQLAMGCQASTSGEVISRLHSIQRQARSILAGEPEAGPDGRDIEDGYRRDVFGMAAGLGEMISGFHDHAAVTDEDLHRLLLAAENVANRVRNYLTVKLIRKQTVARGR